MPKNWCFQIVVLEKTFKSPLDSMKIQPVNPKGNQSWMNIHWKDWCWSSNTLATWCKELTHLKRPRCWERLRAGGEGGDRGWDSWVASPTQWTWIWAVSGIWWKTGKSSVLQSMGSQNWTWLSNWITTNYQKKKKEKSCNLNLKIWELEFNFIPFDS